MWTCTHWHSHEPITHPYLHPLPWTNHAPLLAPTPMNQWRTLTCTHSHDPITRPYLYPLPWTNHTSLPAPTLMYPITRPHLYIHSQEPITHPHLHPLPCTNHTPLPTSTPRNQSHTLTCTHSQEPITHLFLCIPVCNYYCSSWMLSCYE